MQTPQEDNRSSQPAWPLVWFMMAVRGVVFVVVPLSIAVACWWAWPTFNARFDTRQVASGITTPLSYVAPLDKELHSLQAETCSVDDSCRQQLIVEHWLDPLGNPVVRTSGELNKSDYQEEVIGITVDGQSYAFSVFGMINPYYSLIEIEGRQTRFVVSYCCSNQSIKVFASSLEEAKIPIALAGLVYGGGHVLAVDGQCYFQEADDIPLALVEYKRTTLQEWLLAHPESVFVPAGLQLCYTE